MAHYQERLLRISKLELSAKNLIVSLQLTMTYRLNVIPLSLVSTVSSVSYRYWMKQQKQRFLTNSFIERSFSYKSYIIEIT